MGEGVERAAGRMRGLDSILPAAWKNLNRSVIQETLRGQRSTCIAIRRLRSFTLFYLYRRTRSSRRPFSFSFDKNFRRARHFFAPHPPDSPILPARRVLSARTPFALAAASTTTWCDKSCQITRCSQKHEHYQNKPKKRSLSQKPSKKP